jgi:hypothetical protein
MANVESYLKHDDDINIRSLLYVLMKLELFKQDLHQQMGSARRSARNNFSA